MRLGDLLSFSRKLALAPSLALFGLLLLGGCETSGLLDPGEMMRTTQQPLFMPIIDKLDPRDEVEPEYVNADDVRQADLKPSTTDYVIGRNDLLSISISEVAGPGVETVKTTRVSESGNVSLPLIGSIKAAGLTEAELEKTIAQTYRDKGLIQQAQVSVSVLEARQRTFSILGVVGRPGQYQIVQSDFRMLDAITLAGDVSVQGIEYAYIIRKETKPEATTRPADSGKPADTAKPAGKPVDPLDRRTQAPANSSAKVAQAAPQDMTHVALLADTASDDNKDKVLVDGKWIPKKGGTTAPAAAAATTTDPAPLKVADPLKADAPKAEVSPAAAPAKPFEFETPKADTDTRILRVPLDRLQRGELQYNVVIRPNDTIIVPGPKVGEYYMGGHVQRPGVYSLTGRQITLKQAIISAGMIDPLGWPERTEVIRRIGKDKELFCRVNLPKLFAGEQSDFYLRPYDTVNVGTNMLAPFLAAFRGAFRLTYGFGFIYDRNYWETNNSTN